MDLIRTSAGLARELAPRESGCQSFMALMRHPVRQQWSRTALVLRFGGGREVATS
jgi:hypothetical protein